MMGESIIWIGNRRPVTPIPACLVYKPLITCLTSRARFKSPNSDLRHPYVFSYGICSLINHRPHVKSPIQVTEERFTSSIRLFIRYLFRHVSKECLKNGCVSSQVQAAVRKRQTCLRRIPSFILKNDGCVLTQQMQIER